VRASKARALWRVIAAVTALVLCLAGTTAFAAEPQPIKIGAVLGLTGYLSTYGASQRAGLELARDTINAQGGGLGRPIEIIFEDTQGVPDIALEAVRKLIEEDGVLAIIGPTISAEMFAAGALASQLGTVMLGISTTAEGIRDIGPYIFRNSLPEADVLPHTVRVSHEKLGYQTAALLYSENDYFTWSAANTFRTELERAGVRVVATEPFLVGDTDFREKLRRVAAADPDVLVVSAFFEEATLLLTQARELGLNQPVIGGNGFNTPRLAATVGEAAEGAIVGSPWYAGRNHPNTRRFVEEYEARFGIVPDQFAAQSHDALQLFAEAIRRAQTADDRDAFQQALASIRDFEGVAGKFSFNEVGEPVAEVHVLRIENGQYVPLE